MKDEAKTWDRTESAADTLVELGSSMGLDREEMAAITLAIALNHMFAYGLPESRAHLVVSTMYRLREKHGVEDRCLVPERPHALQEASKEMKMTDQEKELLEKIDHWFTYHAPDKDDIEAYASIRHAGETLARTIAMHTTRCADQTAAIRKVREAVMTANAARACKGK